MLTYILGTRLLILNLKFMKYEENRKSALLSAKKANGTLIKVIEMIEADEYCPDIIQQVDAVIGLLKSSKKNLLVGHLDHCLEHKLKENKTKTIDELLKIY
jgi:DNA-binding FrmR family transcriptional regulator